MQLYTVNIKADMPTADQAPVRVAAAIATGRRLGTKAVKIIHGYGSTGQGGRIRTVARQGLQQHKLKGQIKDFIPGEHFSIFNEATRRALAL